MYEKLMEGKRLMRDPNRIDVICNLLKEVWKQYPDKRLGELIANSIQTPICCYVSDEKLEEGLERLLAWAKLSIFNRQTNGLSLLSFHSPPTFLITL
jgi:hypothetical protein